MQWHPKKPKSLKNKQPRGQGSGDRCALWKKAPTVKAKRAAKKRALPVEQAKHCGEFLSLLKERISQSELEGLNQRNHPAGRPAHELARWQLLVGILFHYTLSLAGTFGQHLGILFSKGASVATALATGLVIF